LTVGTRKTLETARNTFGALFTVLFIGLNVIIVRMETRVAQTTICLISARITSIHGVVTGNVIVNVRSVIIMILDIAGILQFALNPRDNRGGAVGSEPKTLTVLSIAEIS